MKKFIVQDDYNGMSSYDCLLSLVEAFPEVIINSNIPYVGLVNYNRDYSSYNNELVEKLYEHLLDVLMGLNDDVIFDDDENYLINYNKLAFIIKDIKNKYDIELSWQDIATLVPELSKDNSCISITEDDMYDFIGNILMKALASKYQAGDYESTCIHGCAQGECVEILCPERLEYVIGDIEASFFNYGEEVHVIDDDNGDDYWDYIPISCPLDKEIEKYIKDYLDAEDGDEIIYMEQEHRIIDVEKKRVTIV